MSNDPGEQLALDRHDPDAMEDRGARLRAELEALDTAKIQAREESLLGLRIRMAAHRTAGAELDDAVSEARAYGATWRQIADAVGLTVSAAHERWRDRG